MQEGTGAVTAAARAGGLLGWENPGRVSTHWHKPSRSSACAYLLGAGQREEQVQRRLGEVQVLLHAQAHLQGGEEGRQDGEPAGKKMLWYGKQRVKVG